MVASAPPATMTSASSRWMRRKASPIQWLPVAQAVTAQEFGPLAPMRMATWPEARLIMVMGMKKGETRPGPFSRNTLS